MEGTIGRYTAQMQNSSLYGTLEGQIDLSAMPVTATPEAAQAGETWLCDQLGAEQGSNFRDAIALTCVQ